MATTEGYFGWYELMTTDADAAASFYTSVIGWTTKDVGTPEMPYTVFNADNYGTAGLLAIPPHASGMPPTWLGYIHVPDVDAEAADVAADGGVIHRPPTDVPGMLRFCVVADPQGTAFVLFTSNPNMPTPPGKPADGTPGTIGWHELFATDSAAAFDWYAKHFGWTKGTAHDMGPMGIYQLFDVKGVETGGMMTRPPQMPVPNWAYYFYVDSIDAAAERIKANGGQILMGPHQVPGDSWVIQAVDPQGAHFNVLSKTK
jgi:predicted enzyme related to lactoylglutathione lyase